MTDSPFPFPPRLIMITTRAEWEKAPITTAAGQYRVHFPHAKLEVGPGLTVVVMEPGSDPHGSGVAIYAPPFPAPDWSQEYGLTLYSYRIDHLLD